VHVLRLASSADIGAFAGPARSLLRELGAVEHGLHLGVIGQIEAGVYDEWRLWSVLDGHRIVGVVLHTPPHPYAVALRPDRSATALAHAFVAAGLEPGDLSGPPELVEPVARSWAELTAGTPVRLLAMHLLTCRRVRWPAETPPGRWRKATPDDADEVIALTWAFVGEALPGAAKDESAHAARVRRHLRGEHGLHLWENDEVVSVAAIGMPAEGGERIASVYTPPRHRGRGYASALVAALTQDAFDRGCDHVQLNTDVDNPTSNAIYERLGYQRVGAQATWRVHAPGP
jgi:RimJ/RimL family protein N-acetyltransferase